jgi:hypothetical protein
LHPKFAENFAPYYSPAKRGFGTPLQRIFFKKFFVPHYTRTKSPFGNPLFATKLAKQKPGANEKGNCPLAHAQF